MVGVIIIPVCSMYRPVWWMMAMINNIIMLATCCNPSLRACRLLARFLWRQSKIIWFFQKKGWSSTLNPTAVSRIRTSKQARPFDQFRGRGTGVATPRKDDNGQNRWLSAKSNKNKNTHISQKIENWKYIMRAWSKVLTEEYEQYFGNFSDKSSDPRTTPPS